MTKDFMPSVAYLFFRTTARFWGSVFFPLFKIWGETEIPTRGGRFFVARYRGLITWITILRIFSRPITFVMSGVQSDLWIKIARVGGFDICMLSNSMTDAKAELKNLTEKKRQFVLLLSRKNPPRNKLLVSTLQDVVKNRLLFLAVHGAEKALPPGAIIPKVNQIVALCALPPAFKTKDHSETNAEALSDLSTLENALARNNSPLEPPSFFFNHERNL